MIALLAAASLILMGVLAVALLLAQWEVEQAPLEWMQRLCRPFSDCIRGVADLGCVVLFFNLFHAGFYCSGALLLCRLSLSIILTLVWRRKTKDPAHPCAWMLRMLSACSMICAPIFVENAFIRHRMIGIITVSFRIVAPIHEVCVKHSILHIIVGTIVEILCVNVSVAHFQEEVHVLRICLASLMCTVMAVLWTCIRKDFLLYVYQVLQQMEIEKEATASVLSMVCDATFWLAADGDTVLEKSPKLEAILGNSMQGQLLSRYMPAQEHARLCTLFKGVPESDQETPVHLLATAITSPSMPTHDVDLFIVDRRFAFSDFAVRLPGRERRRQTAAQQRRYLVGLRLGQPHGAESDASSDPLPAQGLAMPPFEPADGAPDSAAPGQLAAVAIPAGSCKPAEHPTANHNDDPVSCYQVQNTFVTARRRRSTRRAHSAPPRCEAGGTQADEPPSGPCGNEMQHCVVEQSPSVNIGGLCGSQMQPCVEHNNISELESADLGAPCDRSAEYDEQSRCSTAPSSSLSTGSSEGGADIRINACEHPSALGLKSTDSCIHLSDILRVRTNRWKSVGSGLHASGACRVCIFEHNRHRPGKTPCINGVLCARCHEGHTFPSRKLRKAHNKTYSMG